MLSLPSIDRRATGASSLAGRGGVAGDEGGADVDQLGIDGEGVADEGGRFVPPRGEDAGQHLGNPGHVVDPALDPSRSRL